MSLHCKETASRFRVDRHDYTQLDIKQMNIHVVEYIHYFHLV